MMKTSLEGIELLHQSEACKLVAYLDSGGVWTIGWGTIRYPDGRRVLQGDCCSQQEADMFFSYDLMKYEKDVDALTRDEINQRQFDALVNLTYNIGSQGYSNSTVRRLVNTSPFDPNIRPAFMKWHYDNGKPVYGLWARRHREADFYFGVHTAELPYPHPR